MTINASIIGATGYTGLELIRLLSAHPDVQLKYLTSSRSAGEKISSLYPHLASLCDITLIGDDYDIIARESDVVFLALPHIQTQKVVPKIIGKTKIIDLSGDFRLQDVSMYKKYYGAEHTSPEYLKDFVYGFSEWQKEKIQKSSNIANPGCFAITAQLALLPLKGKIKNVEIFAITGSSGSGKNASAGTHHPVRNHNVKSYKIGTHQHLPEISQSLALPIESIHFVPTSGPFSRGIHLTAFVELELENCRGNAGRPQGIATASSENRNMTHIYQEFYISSPFVRIKESVELAEVTGSNFADISVTSLSNKIIVQCVIDNLVKGAGGTAIQNMNLMFGFPEETGLKSILPVYP